MIKIILHLLLVGAIYVFIAEPVVTFKPFSLTFKSGWFAIGMLVLMIGVIILIYDAKQKGYKKGMNDTIEIVKEIANRP